MEIREPLRVRDPKTRHLNIVELCTAGLFLIIIPFILFKQEKRLEFHVTTPFLYF